MICPLERTYCADNTRIGGKCGDCPLSISYACPNTNPPVTVGIPTPIKDRLDEHEAEIKRLKAAVEDMMGGVPRIECFNNLKNRVKALEGKVFDAFAAAKAVEGFEFRENVGVVPVLGSVPVAISRETYEKVKRYMKASTGLPKMPFEELVQLGNELREIFK